MPKKEGVQFRGLCRRSFLGRIAAAAATSSLVLAQPPKSARANPSVEKGLRLSVAWGPMLGNIPVGDGLALLTRLGYEAFELFDWRDPATLESFAREKKKYPLECACLTANKSPVAPGCSLVNPRERDGFVEQIKLSVEAAKKVESKGLLVLSGNELEGISRAEQLGNAVYALRAAAPILEKNNITAFVEPLNNVEFPGIFLYNVGYAAALIDRVNSPNVKILFDLYHEQMMEGNLINNIRRNIDRIGHLHVGDVPGHHEPGTGEINYRNVFKAIYELGDRFQGSVGLEYRPLAPLEENLAAMRKLANFG
jgi:hydroxypyruvate isomerase